MKTILLIILSLQLRTNKAILVERECEIIVITHDEVAVKELKKRKELSRVDTCYSSFLRSTSYMFWFKE